MSTSHQNNELEPPIKVVIPAPVAKPRDDHRGAQPHNGPGGRKELPLLTLLLMVSFAAVNAVFYTPALPNIALAFGISSETAQGTMIWFLVGYTITQLAYGPFANRFGRKPILYAGTLLQIASSVLCVLAGTLHIYFLLLLGRFLLAAGSGAGLKISYTMINEYEEPAAANKKITYLIFGFAILPALAVLIGGILNEHFGWTSCFYACAIYGIIVLALEIGLPETQAIPDKDALAVSHLWQGYFTQFKNIQHLLGSVIMGCGAALIYIFSAISPFVAIKLLGMKSVHYGVATLLPYLGMILGVFFSARSAKHNPPLLILQRGLWILFAGILLLTLLIATNIPPLFALFIPIAVMFYGYSYIYANASILVMATTTDKAYGSAVMNFICLLFTLVTMIGVSYIPMSLWLMPIAFAVLGLLMVGLQKTLKKD